MGGVLHDYKRIILLIGEVWFYSIFCFLWVYKFEGDSLSVKEIIKAFFPTMFGQYWFFTTYVILFVFSPIINRSLLSLKNEKTYQKLLLIMFLLWSVSPTFTTVAWCSESNIVQFVMLYTFGAYMSLFPNCWMINNNKLLLLHGIVGWIGIAVVCNVIGIWIPFFSSHATYFYSKNSPITIVFAIALVIFAIKNEFHNMAVNIVSQSVFAVYLLTDNAGLRGFLWDKILRVQSHAEDKMLILWIILWSLLLFAICVLIDKIRKVTIEKVFINLIRKNNNE